VVILALRVDRDGATLALRQNGEWVVIRSVIEAEHDDRAHIAPERAWVAAAGRRGLHPGHIALRAVGQEGFEASLGVRRGVGMRDAEHVEAVCTRFPRERSLERGRLRQKSRSA